MILDDYSNTISRVSNSLIGGDVVSIAIRQALRFKALGGVFARASTIAELSSIRPDYTPPNVAIVGIPVSTKQQETYTYTADVTMFPVESGAILSDHVILQPMRIDIVATITNWDDGQQASYSFELLEKMWRTREVVEVQTKHRLLKNMIITNLELSNDLPNWGALEINISFMQVDFVQIEKIGGTADEDTKPTTATAGPNVSTSVSEPVNKGGQKLIPIETGSKLGDVFNTAAKEFAPWVNHINNISKVVTPYLK